jgi:hypothetical protein
MASMTVWPDAGLKTRDSRFCSPQSSELDPFRKNGLLIAGWCRQKSLVSLAPSMSAILLSPFMYSRSKIGFLTGAFNAF